MDSTEEQGQHQLSLQQQQQQQQQTHHHRVLDSGSNRENDLEPIDLDHLDTIMPASDRQIEGHPFGPELETSSEVDKRAAQELFDGTLADITDTNTPIIDTNDADTTPANNSDAAQADVRVREENSTERNAQEDLDYNEGDSDTNRRGGDETAINGTSPIPEQPVEQEEEREGEGEEKDQTDQLSTESNLDQDKQQSDEEKKGGEEEEDMTEDFPAQKRGRRKRETDYNFDEVEYIIERIVAKEIDDSGRAKFLVKWENYPSTSNTWEPLENLIGCEKALQKFEQERAKKLAKKCATGQTSSLVGKGKNLIDQKYRVKEIIGMTFVEDVKYFVISLEDPKESPKFIRASLANKMFPDRVIDFYETKIRWDRD